MTRIPRGIETEAPGNYQTRLSKRERKLAESVRKDTNIELTGKSQPIISATLNTGSPLSDAEAAAGDEIGMILDGQPAELHLAVVETTGTALYAFPFLNASGNFEFPLDPNVTDGVTAAEMTFGTTASSQAAYTVGSFPGAKPVFFEMEVSIAAVDQLDELLVGWRKAEAYRADYNDYDEAAAFWVGLDSTDGKIELHTIINGAATVETDTTETDWADTNSKTLRVEVTNAGVVTFAIDGAAPTVTKVFSFDSGEVIIPFFSYNNTTSTTGTLTPGITSSSIECGTK